MPPDLRKQLERTIREGQKTIHTAIKEVQTRLDRTARQADLDKAMKRLEGLSKQVRDLVTGSVGPTAPARPARRKTAPRKPAARKRAPKKRAVSGSTRAKSAAPAPMPEPETERVDGF